MILPCIFLLSLMSCRTSAGIIFDESVPVEQTAWISTANAGTITNYNGISVEWSGQGYSSYIQIPAGDTILVWDVKSTAGYTTYTGKDMLFRYNFEAGKKYIFSAGRREGVSGFNLHAWNFGERETVLSDKTHVDFVPFIDSSGNPVSGRTVLQ